jgi:hypothetical protein
MSPGIALFLTKPAILDPAFYVMALAFRTAMQWVALQTPAMQTSFFTTAAQFQGSTAQIKGPATALKRYLNKLSWTMDSEGTVLATDSFHRVYKFLELAWQQDSIKNLTSRYSLFSMPDIARDDTLLVLKKNPPKKESNSPVR